MNKPEALPVRPGAPEDPPVSPAVRQELERRLATYERDKAAGSSWEAVKARLKQPVPQG